MRASNDDVICPSLPDDVIRHAFVRGFRPELSSYVMQQNPSSSEDWLTAVQVTAASVTETTVSLSTSSKIPRSSSVSTCTLLRRSTSSVAPFTAGTLPGPLVFGIAPSKAPPTPATMSKRQATLSKQHSTSLPKTATMSNEFIVKYVLSTKHVDRLKLRPQRRNTLWVIVKQSSYDVRKHALSQEDRKCAILCIIFRSRQCNYM